MQNLVTAPAAETPEVSSLDFSRIAQDLQIRKVQVEAVVQLLDEGNTVPFITRYRKERTGGLNEEVLRQIQGRVQLLRQLADRKRTILKSIEHQGKLSDQLRRAILHADTAKRLEDLYLPYKPKKRTLATIAREKGLEPLALAIWHRDPAAANLDELLPALVNPEQELPTVEEVRQGVQHILAEMIAETADVRAAARSVLWETGKLCSARSDKLAEGQGLEYKDYFQFTESVRQIPPHRILALNRGEKENSLKVHMEWLTDAVRGAALHGLAESLQHAPPPPAAGAPAVEAGSGEPAAPPAEVPAPAEVPPPAAPVAGEPLSPDSDYTTPHAAFLRTVLDDALQRLLLPSLEREIRRELSDEAEGHAVQVFARNLRSLLLQPPLHGRRVLAIDPGFRTGCKVAALDEHGNLLEHDIIYPHQTSKKGRGDGRRQEAKPQEPKPQEAAPPPAPAAEAPPAPVAEAPPPTEAPPAPSAEAPPPVLAVETPPSAEAPPVAVEAPPAPEAVADTPTFTETPPTAQAAEAGLPAAEVPPPPPPPAPPISKRDEAKNRLEDLVRKHQLNVIAIGNGTACRETEEFVSELIGEKLPELAYVIVNEAGASVYSASQVGREEFPDYDATLRGTISIGRRLQDPLSELVKVDPQSIGVGLYQHDVNPKHLKESLEAVIESCVNQVGVDLNTASVPLLRHVSGMNQMVARDLVEYRKQHGPFQSRDQLLQVPGIGEARYTQAAGFLKIPNGPNPLDRTWIHPESYPAAEKLLGELGYQPAVIDDKSQAAEFHGKLQSLSPEELARTLALGVPTARDILDSLARPGRDPREDLPPPIFKKGILKLEDLQPGMELKGTVLNVVDFGAFVDIGLKDSGLVHISQMANRYIKSPYDVVAVSDVVTVWVLSVDTQRHRVSLTMIKPGTERKPPERRPPQQQRQEGGRPEGARPEGARRPPPRGARPPQQRQGQGQGPPQGAGAGQGPPQGGGRPGQGRGGPPPRRPGGGRPVSGSQGSTPPPAEGGTKPPPRPPEPPRKPRREPPKPKLTQAAIEGKVPLRTFGELSALFAAKNAPPPPPPAPPAAEQPPPPPEPPASAPAPAEPEASTPPPPMPETQPAPPPQEEPAPAPAEPVPAQPG